MRKGRDGEKRGKKWGRKLEKRRKQAGAELGQAQLKLELELIYTSSVLIKL